jgi:hypothetical protein
MKQNLFYMVLAASLLVSAPTYATPQGSQESFLKLRSETDSYDNTNGIFLPLAMRFGTTGERLNIIYSGTQVFPAKTTFYISNWWYGDPTDDRFWRFNFQLQVDGVYRHEDFSELYPIEGSEPPRVIRSFIFNFPSGMSDVHTFVGHWLAPCSMFYTNCPDPDEVVEVYTTVVQVTFVP